MANHTKSAILNHYGGDYASFYSRYFPSLDGARWYLLQLIRERDD